MRLMSGVNGGCVKNQVEKVLPVFFRPTVRCLWSVPVPKARDIYTAIFKVPSVAFRDEIEPNGLLG